MRTIRRHLPTVLISGGLTLLVYAALVVAWRDPITDVAAAYQQRGLRAPLHRQEHEYAQQAAAVEQQVQLSSGVDVQTGKPNFGRQALKAAGILADRFAKEDAGEVGRAIGHIAIPRIGLSTIVVEGTDYWEALSKGPGHYDKTPFPGQGGTIGIAGHRTTWAAPFRHIDAIRTGDVIDLTMPYGTFRYEVTGHRIVDNGDWSIVRRVGYEQLVLSACHPLYSASQRYVVFARLASIALPGKKPVDVSAIS